MTRYLNCTIQHKLMDYVVLYRLCQNIVKIRRIEISCTTVMMFMKNDIYFEIEDQQNTAKCY